MGFFSFLGKKQPEEQQPSSPLNQSTEEYVKNRPAISVGKSIYPMIKPADDHRITRSQGTDNPIITASLAEGITITYGLDIGNGFEMITEHHCKQFHVTREDLVLLSERNLLAKTAGKVNIEKMDFSSTISEASPFYRVRLDNNLDTSLMLVDDFWLQASEMLKTDLIAVTLPAKNILFFADYHDMFSFRVMRPFSVKMYEASQKDNIALSQNTYIRKKGKWILFTDTESQYEELAMN